MSMKILNTNKAFNRLGKIRSAGLVIVVVIHIIGHRATPGGTLNIYWLGCAAAHPKKRGGGLRHGHESKKGGLRHGHESKKGGLKNRSCKKTILVTDVAQKGVLGAYLLITLTVFLST